MSVAAQPPSPAGPGERPVAPADRHIVGARTHGQLVWRRFVRHRGAMAGVVTLAIVVVLSVTSIGAFGLPGWWWASYDRSLPLLDQGRPTLDLDPFDGTGPAIGAHPFGQNDIGNDYFALTMRGTQQSLVVAVTVGLIATVLGVLLGALAGYFRGWVEAVVMRVTDVFITVPLLVVAAVVARRFGDDGVVVLGAVLGMLSWMTLARLVRGEFLALREKDFVEAARAMGAGGGRIIVRHLLPNVVGTIVVAATLLVAAAILLETALSFLGFGVRSPDSSLGLLVSENQAAFRTRPWLFWWPGLFIIAVALSVNFIGDGLRDAFDPRQSRMSR